VIALRPARTTTTLARWLAAPLVVVAPACFEGVKEAPEAPDSTVIESGPRFKPDTGGGGEVRLGGGGSDAGAPDGVARGSDGVAADSDGEERPFDSGSDAAPDAPLADAASPADASADAAAGCGDGKCAAGEDCLACPADCGKCPLFCGNGACDGAETCVTCAKDCGACLPPTCAVLGSKGCDPGKQCFPDGKANVCYAAGGGKHGDACAAFNACEVGVLCVAATCRQLCDFSGKGAAALCKPGVPCEELVFDGGGDVGPDLGACKPSAPCDPLSDAGCPPGQTCTPTGWLKTCMPAGTGPPDSACTGQGACKPGLLCIDSGKGGKCRPRCHTLGESPTCATGVCTAVLGPDGKAVPGFVGYCVP